MSSPIGKKFVGVMTKHNWVKIDEIVWSNFFGERVIKIKCSNCETKFDVSYQTYKNRFKEYLSALKIDKNCRIQQVKKLLKS